jgi:hypothetical protein
VWASYLPTTSLEEQLALTAGAAWAAVGVEWAVVGVAATEIPQLLPTACRQSEKNASTEAAAADVSLHAHVSVGLSKVCVL